jgi:type IV pilus assembly protein PilF
VNTLLWRWVRGIALPATVLLVACVSAPGMAPQPEAPTGVSRDRVTASDETDAYKRARVRLELAAAYFGRGQMTTALDQVKLAIQAEPNLGEAFNMRGLIYASLGDHALAEESFRKALQLNARDADAMHNFGWYLCQQKRYAEANQQFNGVLEMVPLRAGARTLLAQGVCHAFASNLPAAERTLMRAYEIDPSNPAIEVNLSEVLYRLGELERARGHIRRINEMADVANAQTLWLAARIEKRLGNQSALEEIGQQLRSRFPDSRETAAFDGGRFNE